MASGLFSAKGGQDGSSGSLSGELRSDAIGLLLGVDNSSRSQGSPEIADATPTLAPTGVEVPEPVVLGADAGEPQGDAPTPEPVRFAPPPTAIPEVAPDSEAWVTLDDASFYVCRGAPPDFQDDYCDGPAGPLPLAEGQVACGDAWPIGTVFEVEGVGAERRFICNDRGLGPALWLDFFFWEYADGRAFVDSLPWPWRVRVIQ